MQQIPAAKRRSRSNRLQANRALERAPDQRSAFLRQACAGDGALLREVEELLEAVALEEETPIDSVIHDAVLDLAEEDHRTGSRVGASVLGRLLGRGGMGAVYLAERADSE